MGDVAIQGRQIAAVGALGSATAANEVDATGLTVAPGFINMLSHSETSLIADGRSMSELKLGVYFLMSEENTKRQVGLPWHTGAKPGQVVRGPGYHARREE
ncbi:MAG: hypothetical protein IT177_24765 [Acidobacteria bacterium]|nr:hypothetical protein [Acidobacteriota bacterium]